MKVLNAGNKLINIYLLTLNDGYCLIDCGDKKDFEKLKKALSELGVKLDDIKYVILTHAHADHVGALKELLRYISPTVIYNPLQKSRLEAGKNNMDVFVSSFVGLMGSKFTTALVDRYQHFPAVKTTKFVSFAHNPLADYGVSFIPLRGHTVGDLAVKVGSDLFCGDICMSMYPAVKHFPVWCENKFELMKSWETILEDKEIATIYPSHGKPFDAKELTKDLEYWRDKGVFALFKKKQNIY